MPASGGALPAPAVSVASFADEATTGAGRGEAFNNEEPTGLEQAPAAAGSVVAVAPELLPGCDTTPAATPAGVSSASEAVAIIEQALARASLESLRGACQGAGVPCIGSRGELINLLTDGIRTRLSCS